MADQTDVESLLAQIDQMKQALEVVGETEKEELKEVISQLEALVDAAQGDSQGSVCSVNSTTDDSNVDDEYKRFSQEIAEMEKEIKSSTSPGPDVDASSSSSSDAVGAEEKKDGDRATDDPDKESSIKKDFEALEGMKCMAPHEEGWGQVGYYPAMVSHVVHSEIDGESEETSEISSLSDIKVKVVFLQPVVKSQLFCPFYKESRCNFTDFECRYSHGEIVHFSKLRDYVEPDYAKIIPNAKVLAKHYDDLWYRAVVTKLNGDGICEVQFDHNRERLELEIHETTPINDDDDSDSDDESPSDTETESSSGTEFLSCDVLKINSKEVLGEWEKHTTGIGSKIMMKMGYVMGSGLGKLAEGRVVPVDAVMVPQGMSLDHFMLLKEIRNGSNGDFSVEKKLMRAKKKHAKKEQKVSEQEKKVKSVFDFMNTHLVHRKAQKHTETQPHLGKQSSSGLKKELLQLGEDAKKVNKDISKIKQSLKRIEGRDAATENLMKAKLQELEKRKHELELRESSISKEQKCRSDKKKLTEF